jgi:hypothetical protein
MKRRRAVWPPPRRSGNRIPRGDSKPLIFGLDTDMGVMGWSEVEYYFRVSPN